MVPPGSRKNKPLGLNLTSGYPPRVGFLVPPRAQSQHARVLILDYSSAIECAPRARKHPKGAGLHARLQYLMIVKQFG